MELIFWIIKRSNWNNCFCKMIIRNILSMQTVLFAYFFNYDLSHAQKYRRKWRSTTSRNHWSGFWSVQFLRATIIDGFHNAYFSYWTMPTFDLLVWFRFLILLNSHFITVFQQTLRKKRSREVLPLVVEEYTILWIFTK